MAKSFSVCGSVRLTISLFLFVVNVLCYSDRQIMSIAILKIPSLKVNAPHYSSRGLILGIFFAGYLCSMIPTGYMTVIWKKGRLGLLLLAVSIWSTFTILTALSEHLLELDSIWGLVVVCMIRFFMGVGEGMCAPADMALYNSWFPPNERSRLVTLAASGDDFGAIISYALAGPILKAFDWEGLFYIWGGIGLLWVPLFALYGSASPLDHRRAVASGEAEYIERSKVAQKPGKITLIDSYRWALSDKSLIPVYTTAVGILFAVHCMTSWLPTFLKDLGYSLEEGSHMLAFIPLSKFLGGICGGIFADFLISRNVRRVLVRKLMNSVAVLSISLGLPMARILFSDAKSVIIFISCTSFFGKWTASGYCSYVLDRAGDKAGQIFSLAIGLGSIGGLLGQPLVNYILQRSGGDWLLVFCVCSFPCLIGGLLFLIFAHDRTKDPEELPENDATF